MNNIKKYKIVARDENSFKLIPPTILNKPQSEIITLNRCETIPYKNPKGKIRLITVKTNKHVNEIVNSGNMIKLDNKDTG